MKLIMQSMESGNPTIPVRWCVTPEEAAVLKNQGTIHPHILILVSYQNGREDRQLVPLESAMTYLSFRYPGTHEVRAKIYWFCDQDQAKSFKRHFLDRANRRDYYNEVKSVYSEDLMGVFSGGLPATDMYDMQKVTVDASYFAPEPSKFMNAWVNHIYEYLPIDQCEYRKRKVLSTVATPMFLLVKSIAAIMFYLVKALMGLRGMDFKELLHPFTNDLADMDSTVDRNGYIHTCSIFLHDKKCETHVWRVSFNPVIHLSWFTILWGIAKKNKMTIWHLMLVIAKFIFSVKFATALLIILIPAAVIYVLMTRSEKIKDWMEKQLVKLERLFNPPYDKQKWVIELNQAYEDMQCSTMPSVPSLATLPPKRKTLRLRYLDLKAKVCKPFAG